MDVALQFCRVRVLRYKCDSPPGVSYCRFCNGDVYKGYWRDNLRWGHGCMQSGSLSSTGATMYIGEWSNDKRSGYGVLDDILK